MKTTSHFRKGFTMVELLVLLGIVAVLVGIYGNALKVMRTKDRWSNCRNHLKQVGAGYWMFANDHANRFPQEVPEAEGGSLECTNAGQTFKHFQVLNLDSPKVLFCPADKQRQAATGTNIASNKNLSYFAVLNTRSSTNGNMLLAGDRNLSTNDVGLPSGIYVMATNAPAGWTKNEMHQDSGNILITDGSVQMLNSRRLPGLLQFFETNHQVSLP